MSNRWCSFHFALSFFSDLNVTSNQKNIWLKIKKRHFVVNSWYLDTPDSSLNRLHSIASKKRLTFINGHRNLVTIWQQYRHGRILVLWFCTTQKNRPNFTWFLCWETCQTSDGAHNIVKSKRMQYVLEFTWPSPNYINRQCGDPSVFIGWFS